MNDIKIRAYMEWHDGGGYMCEPETLQELFNTDCSSIGKNGKDFPDGKWHYMLSTGLKDKNGKEICEGDIMISENGLENYYYVVEYIYFGLQVVTYLKKESSARGISNGINQSYIEEGSGYEIKGNIYENKDLIKHIT